MKGLNGATHMTVLVWSSVLECSGLVVQ